MQSSLQNARDFMLQTHTIDRLNVGQCYSDIPDWAVSLPFSSNIMNTDPVYTVGADAPQDPVTV